MALHIDRDRIHAFSRFVWRRFLDDKCFETAGALSYTTLFALVPLIAAVFGILTVLPSFADMSAHMQEFLFRNFVPAAGRSVQHYLMQFAGNASKLTTIGIIVFLLSALAMLASIEERFNRIWRVSVRRSPLSRFLMYWTALTLGPLLVVAGLTATSYLTALPLLGGAQHGYWQRWLWGALPFAVTFVGLFAMYELVPHHHVPARHAGLGALLAALLFTLAKWVFSLYVSNVPSYEQIYGQLAVVPIFLVWVYLSWVMVLLGASITASMSAFEYRPRERQLQVGGEWFGLLHMLKHLVRAQREGHGLSEEALLHCEPFMSDDLVQRYLLDLQDQQLVRRTEDEQWVLVRDLGQVSLLALYRGGRYHLPTDAHLLRVLGRDLPDALQAALEALAEHVRADMEVPLADAFAGSLSKPPARSPSA